MNWILARITVVHSCQTATHAKLTQQVWLSVPGAMLKLQDLTFHHAIANSKQLHSSVSKLDVLKGSKDSSGRCHRVRVRF